MLTFDGLVDQLNEVFRDKPWPTGLRRIRAVDRVLRGERLDVVARAEHVGKAYLANYVEDPTLLVPALGRPSAAAERDRQRLILGQLVVGRAAEIVFEARYRTWMQGREFSLTDLRERRSDTDYRLLNGHQRPVFRINIKFTGSEFRRAREIVGLPPEDTFALATYKIHAALEKQDAEHLPYIFVVVKADARAEAVGAQLPDGRLDAVLHVSSSPALEGKRALEDAVVDSLVRDLDPAVIMARSALEAGSWSMLSARRAARILREKLFSRVYALRVRGFAQQFRGAEVDMHYSLSEDLTPLDSFLGILRDEGVQKVTSMLERGDL